MTSKGRILVTGGLGFIGANFINRALDRNYEIVNLDFCTYASNPPSIIKPPVGKFYSFFKGDIADENLVCQLINEVQPNYVVNFAAETHVDRSIVSPKEFVRTNINGTFNLLNLIKNFIESDKDKKFRKFIHVSTDEVYGTLGSEGSFCEHTPYAPNNPYSASKAASDFLVRSYIKTYNLPAIVTNCSNNFGPFQDGEKFIPKIISCVLNNENIPIYGDGTNIRDSLYVGQHVEVLLQMLSQEMKYSKYNIGGGVELSNVELASNILTYLEKEGRVTPGTVKLNYITDRPGHDFRYAINDTRLRSEISLGALKNSFETDLETTIKWYIENKGL